MPVAYAPNPWSAPSGWPRPAPWRLGHELLDDDAAGPAIRWRFVRGGSLASPRLFGGCAALCMLGVGIGIGLWWAGAMGVLPLAGAELALLGLVFGAWSRHARDAETITLGRRELRVEHRFGRRVERAAFRAEWVRVEPAHAARSLVELTGQGRRVRVGRYLRPEWRSALAHEMRAALKHECRRPAWQQEQQEN